MGKGCVAGGIKKKKEVRNSDGVIASCQKKKSAVILSLLNDDQILNLWYAAEMLLTDLAIMVGSNCLQQASFSELGLYVSQWKKIVLTVIVVIWFSLSKLTPASIFSAHCPSLPSIAIFIFLTFAFCFPFLLSRSASPSPFSSLIFLFILFLLRWAQLFICSHCFSLLWNTVLISSSILHPGENKRQIKQLIYLSFVCARSPHSRPIKMTAQHKHT